MPLAFGPDIVEGRVYRGKRRQDNDEEKQAIKELQTILANKNRRSCDCEAQIHELLENCLSCGRLTCTSEGPGKCFSCGNIVLTEDQRARIGKHVEVTQAIPGVSNKQNSAPRTRIIDNQFDQFAIDNKKHLKEEDRRKFRENLDELQAKRYQRKYVLDIDVDNLEAGTQSLPLLEDYQAELQRLQLNHQPETIVSTCTLSDLVHKESQIKYNLEYISVCEMKKRQSTNKEGVVVKLGNNPQKPKQKPQFKSLPHNKQQVPRNKGGAKKPSRQNPWNNTSNKDKV